MLFLYKYIEASLHLVSIWEFLKSQNFANLGNNNQLKPIIFQDILKQSKFCSQPKPSIDANNQFGQYLLK